MLDGLYPFPDEDFENVGTEMALFVPAYIGAEIPFRHAHQLGQN